MPDKIQSIITAFKQVHISAVRPKRTLSQEMFHCLPGVSTGAVSLVCYAPPLEVASGSSNLGPCSVKPDPFISRQVFPFWQFFFRELDCLIASGAVPLSPFLDPIAVAGDDEGV